MVKKKKRRFKRLRRKIRYNSIYAGIQVLIFFSSLMPRKWWLKFLGFLGGLAYYMASHSRTLTLRHLTLAYRSEKSPAEIKKLSKDVFRMLGMNAGDLIRGYNIKKYEEFKKIVVLKGEEHLLNAQAKGKGVIALVSHLGAFEFTATEFSFRGYKPIIIGTPVKDKKLNDLLWKQREKLGAVAVERGKDTLKIMKNLKAGGTMMILIDQDTKVKSRFVNFFGKPCSTPVGATVIAMKTGAAVVPTIIHMRDDFVQEINCYPEIPMTITGNEEEDLILNTQKMSDATESEIRKHPAQWLWMHERWKTKPGEEIR
ncbi:MAG TPA: lysophospholipid acyltransferase family protein [Cyclobacteriaceae bacterium]|nr:lysophospholipid acyltransferase family protein [Cyclobacteriaceae bacterium]